MHLVEIDGTPNSRHAKGGQKVVGIVELTETTVGGGLGIAQVATGRLDVVAHVRGAGLASGRVEDKEFSFRALYAV